MRRRHGKGHNQRMKPAEYNVWLKAKARCFNPKSEDFPDYGGRGITMCPEWAKSFKAFLAAMGPRPSLDHSIDREDTNGNYEPGNCRWATKVEQAENRRFCIRVEWEGRETTAAEVARLTGIPYMTLRDRMTRGMPIEQAVAAEPGVRKDSKVLTLNGESLTVPQWAHRLGLRVRTLRERLRRGMPVEAALRAGDLR